MPHDLVVGPTDSAAVSPTWCPRRCACCLPVVVGQLFERVGGSLTCGLIVACVVAASLFVSGVQASCPDAIPSGVHKQRRHGQVLGARGSPQLHVPAYCSPADGVSSLTARARTRRECSCVCACTLPHPAVVLRPV